MIFFGLNNPDKVVKLHLESFHSGNLAHFHLDQRNSNQNGMVNELNRENQTKMVLQLNRTERAKFSVSPMPALPSFYRYTEILAKLASGLLLI
jgi:hypothetical protein